jgi:hypothetical protein
MSHKDVLIAEEQRSNKTITTTDSEDSNILESNAHLGSKNL